MPSIIWPNVLMERLAVLEQRTPFMTSLLLDLEAVEAGVPVLTLRNVVAAFGMQFKDIHEVVIPARTLKHRKARKELLFDLANFSPLLRKSISSGLQHASNCGTIPGFGAAEAG
jgi:hypothetical protein